MTAEVEWINEVHRCAEDIARRWLTRSEFRYLLASLLAHPRSPVSRIVCAFEFPAPFHAFVITAEVDAAQGVDANVRWDVEMEDSRPTKCHVQCWKKPDAAMLRANVIEAVQTLLVAFWKPNLRTGAAGIPDVKRSRQVAEFADASLATCSSGCSPAVLFCDLDKFKNYNDAHGQTQGDVAIRTFGAVIEVCASEDATVMHNGGDEFLLMHIPGGELTALKLAQRVRNAVGAWVSQGNDLGFTVSIGIATQQVGVEKVTFDDLTRRAEAVVKNELKGPGREVHQLEGSVRFAASALPATQTTHALAELREMAKCLVKSCALTAAPFTDVWLNAVSATVQEARAKGLTLPEIGAAVGDFLRWINPTSAPHPLYAHAFGWGGRCIPGTAPVLSPLDWAFAVAHGLIRILEETPATPPIIIRHDVAGSAAAVFAEPDAMVWRSGSDTQLPEEFALGPAPVLVGAEPADSARAVLIKIGHQPMQLPETLFSTVMVVDDRPTAGGGLPDFWEITIARLVAHIVERLRLLAVFVLGSRENGARTTDKLEKAAAWKEERDKLAERLPVSAADIATASDRLIGRVHFSENEAQLVLKLAHILHDPPPLEADTIHAPAPPRPLHRPEMNTAGLLRQDGCRVATLADAYPTVLQILRASDAPTIRDQAGQHLRELTDFKVVLSKPGRDIVPAYFTGQEAELNAYYERAFLDPMQLFDRALQKDGQLEIVLKHVREILKTPELQIATRRAVLVVPHECKVGGPCAPLGLTSIRIIPRFETERIVLHFSFTWRTVEALIGFPYSLYGTVRYSERLTERVCTEIPAKVRARVTIGEVSYIAYSLHLFVDEYGQEIARRIVNDASD